MFKLNFVGIGISKAGTSWLHENLKSHPDCRLPIYRKDRDLLRQTLRAQTWQRIASKVTVHQLSGQEDLVLPVTRSGEKP